MRFVIALAALLLSFVSTAEATPVTAQRTADFQHMWGTSGSGCGTVGCASLAADIAYTGIKRWRTGGNNCGASPDQIIKNAGLTFTYLPWFTSGSNVDIPTVINNIKNGIASGCTIDYIEGLNEPINFPITYNGVMSSPANCTSNCSFIPVAQWMRDFYAAVKADPVLKNIPVLNCTNCGAEWDNVGLQYLTIPTPLPSGVIMPAGTIYADIENSHEYPIFQGSAQTIQNGTDYIYYGLSIDYVSTWHGFTGVTQAQANAKRKVMTEWGFQTGTPSPNGTAQDAVTQGKNIVTGLLNYFAEGYELAAIYTFYPRPEDSGWELFYGAGNPKPSATYMHNLATIIGDTAANARSFTTGTLGYSISGLPAGGTSMLLQKSNGIYELIIWNNVQNWNKVSGSAITVAPTTVTVNFDSPQQAVKVYDVTSGTSPISTATPATSATISLTDHAMVVEVTPSTGGSYPAPYTCSRNFYVSTSGVDQGGCGTTQGNACATIQGANNNIALQSGDCVNVAGGTYGTNSVIDLTKGGGSNQASGYVAYKGDPNHATHIQWNSNSTFGLILDAPYIILDGFDFDGNNLLTNDLLAGGPDSRGVTQNVNTNVHHEMIINNILRNAAGSGFGTANGDYFIVGGNIIHDTATCSLYGQSAVHILWPTAIPGFNPTLPWDTQTYHIQYIGNIAHDNGWRANSLSYGTCPPNDDGSGLNADNFQLQNWSGGGNPGSYPYHALFAGNLAYNNGSRGINANSANNIDFYNNTTYNNGLNNDARHGFGGGYPDHNPALNCEMLVGGVFSIRNSILYGSTPGSTAETATLCWFSAYGFPEAGSVQNTDIYNGTGGSGVVVSGTQNDAGNSASITAAGSNNLVAVNPLFNSVTNLDFHPQSTSPVLGKGVPIPSTQPDAVATNDGFAFTSPPPMGAYNAASGSVVSSVPGPVSIVTGGPAAAPFVADAGFNGGIAYGPDTAGTIDTSLLLNVPPQAALNWQRYGPNFSYVVSGLAQGKTYESVLYFTEDFDTGANQRLENVLINGQQVLTNFDIYAATGAQHKAVAKTFFGSPDGNGNITYQFVGITGFSDNNAKIDALQTLLTTPGPVSILTGGPAAAPFIADDGFSGGTATGPWGVTVDTSSISNPPPANVFQYERYGPAFWYVITGLSPGTAHTVNLFFTENFSGDNGVGKRLANVTINGVQVLTAFDIYGTAGALYKAIEKSFTVTADSLGSITMLFQGAGGSADSNAKVDGIQVLATAGNPPVAQNQSASTAYQTAVQINLATGATGSPTSAAIVGTPVGGNVSLSGTTATFTPNAGFSGAASFQFTLSNSNGASNTATASISVAGPVVIAPVAANKNVTTQFQTPISVDLSANATNGPTSAAIASNPTNGGVSLVGFIATYTPNAGFSGQDSYTFTLANSGGTSNTATVTIIVNPQASTTCP